jgi:hypothetical protein
LAPNDSLDKNVYSLIFGGLLLLGAIFYPLYMVYKFKKHPDQFNLQKLTLGLFFIKRVCFVLITFFLAEGCLQCLALSYVYFISMVIFSHFKPLGSVKSNRYGMFNDFVLLTVVLFSFPFAGLQDESVKYEIGKIMLIIIAIFIVVNIYYFVDKGMSNLRPWIL